MAKTMERIPREQLRQWLQNPVTKEVLEALHQVRSHLQNSLLNGQTLILNSPEQTALQTTLLLGKLSGLNLILEMELSDASNDE